jgi:acetyltransferase-like isoleucine patch superfamily enzyme
VKTSPFFRHPTAEIATQARIGEGTQIWNQVQVREYECFGEQCRIGKGAYIDAHIHIGSFVKIQNHVSIFEGVTIEDGVFIGPHVCFTNDLLSRAITPEGKLKNAEEWVVTPTLVKYGASIGAGAVIVCGVTIGEFALVGAGSVVAHDSAPHALVFGNSASPHGYVCRCACRLINVRQYGGVVKGWCETCAQNCSISITDGEQGEEKIESLDGKLLNWPFLMHTARVLE